MKNSILIGGAVIAVIGALFVGYSIEKPTNNIVQPEDIFQAKTIKQDIEPLSVNDEKKSIQKTPVVPKNSNIEKKMQCSVYIKQIDDELFQGLVKLQIIGVLYQVFYSPSLDTCLSAKYLFYPAGGSYNGTPKESQSLIISDILTGKIIWSQIYEPPLNSLEAETKLDNRIKTLD